MDLIWACLEHLEFQSSCCSMSNCTSQISSHVSSATVHGAMAALKGKSGQKILAVGRHLASMESKGCQNVGVSNIDWETTTLYYIPCLFYAISMPTQLESARHSQSRKLKEICDRLPVPDLCFLNITWLLCHHCFPLQLAQVSLGWAKRRTVAATMATDTVEPQKTGAIFCPQLLNKVKSSHQNVLGRRQTILQTLSVCCNAVIPLEYSNKMTQTFFFSSTQCASAPLGSWWSETWHISSEVERLGLGSIDISARFCKYIMEQMVWEDYC